MGFDRVRLAFNDGARCIRRESDDGVLWTEDGVDRLLPNEPALASSRRMTFTDVHAASCAIDRSRAKT